MPSPRAVSRLTGAALALVLALAGVSSASAADFVDPGLDPRYSTIPRLDMPADPSVPKPAELFTYALHERSGVVHIVDGSWEELPYTYEVLVDGRVLQEQGPGNIDFWSGYTRVPFHTSIPVSDLEPGTQHVLGVRRLTPDWRRSATTTITVTTPGERVPDAERPSVPELEGVQARGTKVTLQFKPGEMVEPYELSPSGIDIKLPGRELSRGMSSDGAILVTGLTPNTTYRGEARTRNIRGDTSRWIPITFTTGAQPTAPLAAPTPWISVLSTHGADISWEPLRDAAGELAQPWYRLDGGPSYPAIQTDAEAGTLPYWTKADGKPVQPGTTHRVDLWWIDLDGRRTETKTITFTTKPLPAATPTSPDPMPTTPAPAKPTTPVLTTPKPTTPDAKPTTPAVTTPTVTVPVRDEPAPAAPAIASPAPSPTATPITSPPAAPEAKLAARAEPLTIVPAGPTVLELRGVPLAVKASGTELTGRASFGRPVSADGITLKVAVRAKDCRWWRFGQSRFAGTGRAGRATRTTICIDPPSWRSVKAVWNDRTASFAVPLGERLVAGRYAIRVRFQRGRTVLAQRTAALEAR